MRQVLRRAGTPLAFYYAITLALPLANGAEGPGFLGHAFIVLVTPPALILLFCASRAGVLKPFRRKPSARTCHGQRQNPA